jgi:hypothetical protein
MSDFENELNNRRQSEAELRQERETAELAARAQEEFQLQQARQAEHIRLRTSTPVHEAFGDNAPLALEFLEFMKKNHFKGADNLQIVRGIKQEYPGLFSAILNVRGTVVNAHTYVRGYPVGRRVTPANNGRGESVITNIILCADETVREGERSGFTSAGKLHLPRSSSVGNLAGPGYVVGLYDHEVQVTAPRRDDSFDTSWEPGFHEMSLKETLHTIADNVL